MKTRTKRQIQIVQTMIEDALVSAREFERECAAYAERQRDDEMVAVMQEFSEWIEDRELARLEMLGITMEEDARGQLLFHMEGTTTPFVVRARTDLTLVAGGRIFHLNPELPILEEDVYAGILSRLLNWARRMDRRSTGDTAV